MKKLNGVSYDATMELVSKAFGGISFDSKMWELKKIPNGIRLIRKRIMEFYDLTCGVFALQQISPNTFVIHYTPEPGEYYFSRAILDKGIVTYVQCYPYSKANLLSPNFVLFNKDNFSARAVHVNQTINPFLLDHVSIKNSIQVASHIVWSTGPDESLCDSRKIRFIYGDDPQYPKYLKVEYELSSVLLTEYVQILLDPVTLQQVSPAYSTIRDKYFTLTESFTLHDLIAEDRNYVRTATDFLLQIYSADGRKTDEELIATIADH